MKICIIKLGADGDVLRTLPLAKAMSAEFKGAEINWITRGDVATLIDNLPYIRKVLRMPCLESGDYDVLYNFDIEKDATELAEKIKADKKYGFYSDSGYPAAFNSGAEYYLNTMFDDELKKANKKTYQEMMFMASELPYDKYKKERCEIILNEEDRKYAQSFIQKNNLGNKKIIGIHMGSGSRWPSKAWHKDRVKDFIIKARNKGYEILLFGGPNEAERHKQLIDELKNEKINIYRNNPENTKREFASLVSICSHIVCSDSFALHVALNLGVKTTALFFVTSPDEIETYGLIRKIISPRLKEFFPERSNEYDEQLVNSITADEVLAGIN